MGPSRRGAVRRRKSKHSFCAFCRTPRIIYAKKHISLGDAGLCVLSALLLGIILWQDFDPRIGVFFAIGLGISELFVIFRWRISIVCPHCGFDPVLYKRAPELAAARVKRFLDDRRSDPFAALGSMPHLPTVIKRSERGPQGKTAGGTDAGAMR